MARLLFASCSSSSTCCSSSRCFWGKNWFPENFFECFGPCPCPSPFKIRATIYSFFWQPPPPGRTFLGASTPKIYGPIRAFFGGQALKYLGRSFFGPRSPPRAPPKTWGKLFRADPRAKVMAPASFGLPPPPAILGQNPPQGRGAAAGFCSPPPA